MPDQLPSTEVSFKEPIRIVIENKKDDDKPKPLTPWYKLTPTGLDFIKWLLGTLTLGALGWYTNYKVETTRLTLQRMEIDAKLIDAVSGKFDADIHKQLSYLNYIEPFITTDSIKAGVHRRSAALGNAILTEKADSLHKENTSQATEINKKISQPIKNKLTSLAAKSKTPTGQQQDISQYKAEVASLLRSSSMSPTDSFNATAAIQKTKELSTPTTENNYILVGSPETKWSKAGYYVRFNNTLQVGVNDVTKNSIIVNLNRIENSNAVRLKDSNNVTILAGSFIQIDDGPYRYKISLDYVGPAGKNPFTRAGYITVATYKKM